MRNAELEKGQRGLTSAATDLSAESWIAKSSAGFAVSRITRTQAYGMGVKIYDPNTREPITPELALEAAGSAPVPFHYRAVERERGLRRGEGILV